LKAIQLFLPTLETGHSPASLRDIRRTFDTWSGESTVWLRPDLKDVIRWREGTDRHCVAIPAEHFERINVYHVSRSGFVRGPGARDRFPGGRAGELLSLWLNCPRSTIELVQQYKSVHFMVPHFIADQVQLRNERIDVESCGAIHINSVDEGNVIFRLPPAPSNVPTVSPDAESDEWITEADRRSRHHLLSLQIRWPEPLRRLVPILDGLDLVLAQEQMCEIAKQSGTDLRGCVSRARGLASLVSEGLSNRLWSEVLPVHAGAGEDAALARAEDFGVTATSLVELRQHPKLLEPLPIRRAWGPAGLFWTLLIDWLEENHHFQTCQRCDRFITGKMGKKFCSVTDNPACFKARRVLDQRRSRSESARMSHLDKS
jgi:hypothetical protein